ncbi:MAG: TetR/AcrR family transcriptional regulator [Actinomycetota bacterium]|nr:TetR/AcrR family transcriptional regulator [Actinomycetota bacterium]
MRSVVATEPDLLPPCPGFSDARRRVFEAAIVLFGERGYHAVSVRDLATKIGLTPMAIYAHVASKQDLLFEIMTIGHTTHRDRLSGALLDAGPEPEEQIRALCRAHVLVHLEYPALARVTNREAGALGQTQTAVIQRLRAEAGKVFRDVVTRGQKRCAFTDDNPTLLVQAVGGMGIRAAEWWTPAVGISVEEVVETFADFAVRILTACHR